MITSIVAVRATPFNDDDFSFPFWSAMLAVWEAEYDIPGIENAGYPTENGENTDEQKMVTATSSSKYWERRHEDC